MWRCAGSKGGSSGVDTCLMALQDLLGYRLDDAVDRARVRHGFLSVSPSRSRLSQMGGSQNGAATPEAFV